MEKIDLSGVWQLKYGMTQDFAAMEPIPCRVPGNFETALLEARIIDDPYIRMNALQLRKFEFFDWELERDFELSIIPGVVILVVDGLDTYAECFINGHSVGITRNALIAHRLDITDHLQEGRNRITIRLKSAVNQARNFSIEPLAFSAYPFNYESLMVRKPAHAWGWDIAPRMALGGLWRTVYLDFPGTTCFSSTYLQTVRQKNNQAEMLFHFNFTTDLPVLDELEIILSGRCGESSFEERRPIWFTSGVIRFSIPHPLLWQPRGHGQPYLYQVDCQLRYRKNVIAKTQFRAGIRTIELQRKEITTELPEPDFALVVNGKIVRCHGTNHVPADALHANDRARLENIQKMLVDLNCNMVRMWGGGVYEPDLFYDFCDENGILIWQDFMMGCAAYPQIPDFLSIMEDEVISVVNRLRQHPSLALWAGDNECDLIPGWVSDGFDPNWNRITRELIPGILQRLDPCRPYLPSSPYVSPQAFERETLGKNEVASQKNCPEQHLWGPRNYFKSQYYLKTNASFVSEIGYHGCPSVSSIKRFVSPEKIWPYMNNEEWDYHGSNPFIQGDDYLNYRTGLMARQTQELFGSIPDKLESFVIASQICQAEAKKFFIENCRAARTKMTGILWWNLADCWPQFSDAVVDYYGVRKLAYYYIRRSQSDVLMLITEPQGWQRRAVMINDTLLPVAGTFEILDWQSGRLLAGGRFDILPDSLTTLAKLDVVSPEQQLILMKWQFDDGSCGVNHYLAGMPPFDLVNYQKHYLPAIAELDNTFAAAAVGH